MITQQANENDRIPPYHGCQCDSAGRGRLDPLENRKRKLRAFTRYMVFGSWDDLFRFMEERLELPLTRPNLVLNLELLFTEIRLLLPCYIFVV